MQHASREHRVAEATETNSLLAGNCNVHWCEALNLREQNELKWFAMLHSDVIPEAFWLDKLIAEAEKHQADMMSAVVPIKTDQGLTSTAICRPGGPFGRFQRL